MRMDVAKSGPNAGPKIPTGLTTESHSCPVRLFGDGCKCSMEYGFLNIRGCPRFETTDTICDAELWFVSGHDFSRAVNRTVRDWALAPEVLFSRKRMGFKRVEKNRRSPDAISPEGTGQSVARHGSAGKHFKQIESRRVDTMGSSHADSSADFVRHLTGH